MKRMKISSTVHITPPPTLTMIYLKTISTAIRTNMMIQRTVVATLTMIELKTFQTKMTIGLIVATITTMILTLGSRITKMMRNMVSTSSSYKAVSNGPGSSQ